MIAMAYLSFIASTGLIFMALVAGISPASVPSTAKVIMMASACDRFIWNCGVDISLAVRVCVTPNAKAAKHMPAIPATAVSIIPSDRICTIISDGFAPIARRIPISCVRSFTMTHMMFR